MDDYIELCYFGHFLSRCSHGSSSLLVAPYIIYVMWRLILTTCELADELINLTIDSPRDLHIKIQNECLGRASLRESIILFI